jgi:hypothetical protein
MKCFSPFSTSMLALRPDRLLRCISVQSRVIASFMTGESGDQQVGVPD